MITKDNAIFKLVTEDVIVQSYAFGKKGDRYWKIIDPLIIELFHGPIISIPRGFFYDMATIPKFMWSILRPYDRALLAYLIHDYLYIHQEKHRLTRFQADREMLFWANLLSDNKFNNILRYVFVRALGWLWWKKLI